MTQLIDISINDGKATPVSRLFSAQNAQSGNEPAMWYYKQGLQRTSFVRLSQLVRRSGSNASTKVQLQLVLPQVDAVTGVENYRLIGKFELTVPDVATDADIADALAFVANGLNNATIKSSIKDLSPML